MSRSPYLAVVTQVVALYAVGCVAGATVSGPDAGGNDIGTSCQTVQACVSGDDCCPSGCSSATDQDCSSTCGNDVVEAPETCDGDCPTICDDSDPCTGDLLMGVAATCNAQCVSLPIIACASGDGCCPSSCSSSDSDCCGSVELCNGTSDDCDASVDEGCPSGFTLGAAVPCGCAYGGSGGSPFALSCGVGQVLIGFDGRADHSVTQLRPACASLTWSETSGSPEDAFAIETTGSTLLANAGDGQDGSTFTDRCPPNQVVIGIHGRWGDITGSRNEEVEVFAFSCGLVHVARAGASGPWQITITRETESADHGGSITPETPYEYLCPAGNVATVFSGHAGERVDQVSLGCAPLTLQTL